MNRSTAHQSSAHRAGTTPCTAPDPHFQVPIGEDPTLVTRQPALRTARRRRWLVPAGLLGAIAVVVLLFLMDRQPGISILGVTAVAGLYLVMLTVAIATPDSIRRNQALAITMWAMAAAGALAVVAVLFAEANGLSW